MNPLYYAIESTEQGKPGVLVRYPDKGIAMSMAEQVAREKNKQLLEQWPRAINRDGAMHWFFEYRQ